ncbi:ClpXP protease specificity-enhancing factor [Candidatus Pseudomonas adelgestsugas]|uniref:Stringent starvation protein B n=1 Tax=Candidatus Pseudomonas adelgestsugas TaxID=1302376 RepID=A0ABX5R8X3_9PSED|nr:ClpXP protease specificity-enhancing factor [Candidatus Pseudomonas adelgestsugas]QAX81871.1 Stringent starvation protein B [Candidatus Pseudomonas adelgestsugas]
MNSIRPYLVRALYEWIIENHCTPYMLVNSTFPKVDVPQSSAIDGQIVLNISTNAVRYLHIGNEAVSFEGCFSGVPHKLFVPIRAILGIYIRENSYGMLFDLELPFEDNESIRSKDSDNLSIPKSKLSHQNDGPSLKVIRPNFKIVK